MKFEFLPIKNIASCEVNIRVPVVPLSNAGIKNPSVRVMKRSGMDTK